MKRFLMTFCMLFSMLLASAQDVDYLDENRVYNGIDQIQNSNRNYFTNEGWYTTWNQLSGWYPDVLVNSQEAKRYIKQALNSREVYKRFDDLNYMKQNKSIRYQDIDAFNEMIKRIIWREIDRLYPPAN